MLKSVWFDIKDWFYSRRTTKKFRHRKIYLGARAKSSEDYQDDYIWVDKDGVIWCIDYDNNYIYCDRRNVNRKIYNFYNLRKIKL